MLTFGKKLKLFSEYLNINCRKEQGFAVSGCSI